MLALVALLLGCSQNEHPELRRVTGTVIYNGEPLGDAIVAFYNDNSSRLASGHTDVDGKFFLTSFSQNDGAIPGDHNVVVTKVDGAEEEEVPSLSMDEALTARPLAGNTIQLLVPKKYTSLETTPLVVSVSDNGLNDVTINLED